MPKGRGSPIRFNYTDQIPGYDAGDNPLGDITPSPSPRPRPPQDTPPQDPPAEIHPDYQDAGLGGGDGSYDHPDLGGVDPSDVPPSDDVVYVPPIGPEVSPGDFDGDGIPNESDPDHLVTAPDDFSPHYMYNPNTGERVYVSTFEEHLYWEGMGYVHDKPANAPGDYTLIGVISLLFFGGLILGLRK